MDPKSVHWEQLAALFKPPLGKTKAFEVFKALRLPKDPNVKGYYLLEAALELIGQEGLPDDDRQFSAVESVRWALSFIDPDLFLSPVPPAGRLPTKKQLIEIKRFIEVLGSGYGALETVREKLALQAGAFDRAAELDSQRHGGW